MTRLLNTLGLTALSNWLAWRSFKAREPRVWR